MSLTKIGSIGINTGIQFAGVTTIATLNSSSNILSVGGTVNFNSDVSIGGSVSIGGTLTYEDVTNIDSVGLVTARNGIVVGSGITLSKDGDIFATGVTTATTFVGALTGNVTGNISGGTVSGTTGNFSSNADVAGELTVAENIAHTGDTHTRIRFPANDTITADTGGSERLRITSGGLLLLGTETTTNNIRLGNKFGVVGTTAYTGMSITNYSGTNAAHSPMFDFNRSRGTSDQSMTAVADDDKLGEIIFRGSDGSDFNDAVTIRAFVDGTPSDGTDMPGRLVFSTSAEGSAAPTERLRITSDGKMGLGTISPSGMFEVQKNGVPSIISNYNNSKHVEMSVGGSGGGFKVTDGNFFTINHQPYADRGTDSNLTERVRIASNGNIGIGTANPAKTVHINGIISGFQIAPHALGFDIGVTEGNIAPHYGSDFILYNGAIGSGTEKFRCSAEGYVTKLSHPSFFAYMDGGNQTTSANNTIPFNQTHHNTGSHFKTSGTNAYKFVVPVSGHYHFSGAVWMKNTGTGAHARYQLRKGGVIMCQAGWHQNATQGTDDFLDHSAPFSATIYCDTGDLIHLFADYDITYWRGGSGHPHTFFTGHLIG